MMEPNIFSSLSTADNTVCKSSLADNRQIRASYWNRWPTKGEQT